MTEMYRRVSHFSGLNLDMRPKATSKPRGSDPISVKKKIWIEVTMPLASMMIMVSSVIFYEFQRIGHGWLLRRLSRLSLLRRLSSLQSHSRLVPANC